MTVGLLSFANTNAMPAGASGIWYASDYETSPRKRIKNSLGSGLADYNLITPTRRMFTAGTLSFYTNTLGVGVTLVDANATAPDGTGDASTLTSPGSVNWNIKLAGSTITVPAGTYTLCVSAMVTSGSGDFRMGDSTLGVGAKTATGSWQRFSQQIVVSATTLFAIVENPVAQGAQTLLFCDYELFAGSSDLNPNALAAAPQSIQNIDLKVGRTQFDATSSVSSGALQNGSTSLLQFPTLQTPSAFTVLYCAKRSAVGTAAAFQAVVSKADSGGNNYTQFTCGNGNNNIGTYYAASHLDAAYNSAAPQINFDLWAQIGSGPFVGAHRYDGTTASSFVNGVKLLKQATTVAAPTFKDLFVGLLANNDFSGMGLYALAYYPRALTDTEIVQAYKSLAAKVSVTNPRTVVFEGTSICAGQAGLSFAYRFGPNSSPFAHGTNNGVGGSKLSDLTTRGPALDAMIPIAPAQTFILAVEVGANDIGLAASFGSNPNGFTTALATYLDARRAAGWKVVIHTIIARNDGADSGTQFNIDRATANTTIRGWVGSHCDAIADVAGDATIGTDAAMNNATYSTDHVHPLDAGYIIWEPYTRAAINGL
jgi:lysophospholipase L1-like esterase